MLWQFTHGDRLWLIGSHIGAGAKWESVYAPLELSANTSGPIRGVAPLVAWLRTESASSLSSLEGNDCGGRSQAPFESWGVPRQEQLRARERGRKDALKLTTSLDESGSARTLRFMSWMAPEVVVCTPPSVGPTGVVVRGKGLVDTIVRLREVGGCVPGPPHSPSNCRLSLNGLFLPLPGSHGILLGLGHLHRGHANFLSGRQLPRRLVYGGHHYTHFFVTVQAHPPYSVHSLGSEFCLGQRRPKRLGIDCEVVQFVTGLVRGGGDELWLTYGANDCYSKLAKLSLRDVLADLREVAVAG